MTRLSVLYCILAAIIASMFVSHNVAFSQHPLHFDRITQRDGLSDPSVVAMCQDVCGAMWFGTPGGVERYDGYRFRQFKIGMVYSLCADERGFVWIGHWEKGLYCYDIANDTLISYLPPPDDPMREACKNVRGLHVDRTGDLWVGLQRGLARFNTKERRFVGPLVPSVRWHDIYSIVEDALGNLWMGADAGLVKLERGSGRSTLYPYALESTSIPSLAFGHDGKLWVDGGNVSGLMCFDTTRREWQRVLFRGKLIDASGVLVEDDGRVWATTATSGLKIYDPRTGSWEEFHHRSSDPQSLTSDRIGCIYRDNVGNFWFGTRNGVSKLARWRKQFLPIPHNTDDPNSPPKVPIRSICEDHNGNLWIASWGDGVKVWNRRTGLFKVIRGISGWVNVVLADRFGWMWIGTMNPDCLTAINSSTGERKVYRHDQNDAYSIPAGAVLHLNDEPDGSIWVGTQSGGIGCIDRRTGRCLRLKPLPGLKRPEVRCFYRDGAGVLWAFVHWSLLRVSGKTGEADVLQPKGHWERWEWTFNAMHEDRDGRFWVGTNAGFGLLDRSNGNLTYLRRDDQWFQSSATYGILDDDHGNLWLMTTQGVSRFCPATNEFKDFGVADGYPQTNVSVNGRFGTSSYCRTKDGFLVLGTGEGIVLFHPDSIHTNPNPPNVIITNIKVAGIPTRLGMSTLSARHAFEFRPIELLHNQNSITFEFAALDYTAPSQNAYAHKLEGLEENWIPTNNGRSVEYVNLSAGSYVFRVKASNNDGVWNEEGAFVKITILPPWWMSWWFRVLAALIAVASVILIMQLRIRRAVEQERLRLQIASDLHDDVGSSLSSIALVSENIRDVLGEGHPALCDLDSVTNVARQAADRLRDDVWIIKPGSDSLENLVIRMKDVTQSVIGHMKHSFSADTGGTARQVPLAFRRNVLLIYKEALHNILKHSRATSVEISVRLAEGSFTLDVRDNGKGFDTRETPKGNGLVNMRRRADALNGNLLIDSAKDQGTHIHFTAKIPRTRY